MIEPEIQNKYRIPTNTSFAILSVLFTGITLVMKQNGYLPDQIHSNKVIGAGMGALTMATSLIKAGYEYKYEYVPTDPDKTKRIYKEAIREGLVGLTSIALQFLI